NECLKAGYLEKYKKIGSKDFNKNDEIGNEIKICKDCNIEKIINTNDGTYICENCGDTESITLGCSKSSKNGSNKEKPKYPYKRINHFKDWLSQFQAKETTDIPDEIYNLVINELSKHKYKTIKDYKQLKPQFMKSILKKLGLVDYYEHIIHIIYKLNGNPPPIITRE